MMTASSPLSVGIAVDDRILRQSSENALRTFSSSAVTTQTVPERGAGLLALANREKPGVLLADLQALGDDFGDVIRQLRSLPSPPDIIVLHSAADASAILKSMRAGAREFFFEEIESSLRDTIKTIGVAAASPQAHGKLYAFLAVKGGCGATTLASYTAATLARDAEQRVLLADFHWDSPSTAFLLRETPQHSMQDVLRKMDRMDASLWDAMATRTSHGFALSPTPKEGETAGTVDPYNLRSLLHFVKTQYGHVIADCGSGWNTLTPALLECAEETIVVTTADVAALHHAKRLLTAMRERSGYGNVRILLNRVGKRPDLANGDLENILGHQIFGSIPNDYRSLQGACEKGALLPAEHAFSQAVSLLAGKLAGNTTQQKKKLFPFFGK